MAARSNDAEAWPRAYGVVRTKTVAAVIDPWLLRAYVLLGLREAPASVEELRADLASLGVDCEPADLLRELRAAERDELTLSLDDGRVHVLLAAGERELERMADELRESERILGAFLARCGEQLVLDAVTPPPTGGTAR